ncbi:MAG: hypothetical protein KDA61_17115, partial [Planctomycetales bacterium]|nr:hypothetical protein [Planctomycetales bacterium]
MREAGETDAEQDGQYPTIQAPSGEVGGQERVCQLDQGRKEREGRHGEVRRRAAKYGLKSAAERERSGR